MVHQPTLICMKLPIRFFLKFILFLFINRRCCDAVPAHFNPDYRHKGRFIDMYIGLPESVMYELLITSLFIQFAYSLEWGFIIRGDDGWLGNPVHAGD